MIDVLLVYFCIAARGLQQHAQAVHTAWRPTTCRWHAAKSAVVSRECEQMTVLVAPGNVDSVLENGADAIFAPLVWFVLLGPFGILLHRLANTLDAMWGYKNQRYQNFGWAAARLDDVLNWLPARLTAVSYAALGDYRLGLFAWRHQAHLLDSPNAGPVMAAGAGALNLELGGPARYHGQLKNKPWFGGQHAGKQRYYARHSPVYATLGLWLGLIAVAESLI